MLVGRLVDYLESQRRTIFLEALLTRMVQDTTEKKAGVSSNALLSGVIMHCRIVGWVLLIEIQCLDPAHQELFPDTKQRT